MHTCVVRHYILASITSNSVQFYSCCIIISAQSKQCHDRCIDLNHILTVIVITLLHFTVMNELSATTPSIDDILSRQSIILLAHEGVTCRSRRLCIARSRARACLYIILRYGSVVPRLELGSLRTRRNLLHAWTQKFCGEFYYAFLKHNFGC